MRPSHPDVQKRPHQVKLACRGDAFRRRLALPPKPAKTRRKAENFSKNSLAPLRRMALIRANRELFTSDKQIEKLETHYGKSTLQISDCSFGRRKNGPLQETSGRSSRADRAIGLQER